MAAMPWGGGGAAIVPQESVSSTEFLTFSFESPRALLQVGESHRSRCPFDVEGFLEPKLLSAPRATRLT